VAHLLCTIFAHMRLSVPYIPGNQKFRKRSKVVEGPFFRCCVQQYIGVACYVLLGSFNRKGEKERKRRHSDKQIDYKQYIHTRIYEIIVSHSVTNAHLLCLLNFNARFESLTLYMSSVGSTYCIHELGVSCHLLMQQYSRGRCHRDES